jgi:hypothetical protein
MYLCHKATNSQNKWIVDFALKVQNFLLVGDGLVQSCPWVIFFNPSPTQQLSYPITPQSSGIARVNVTRGGPLKCHPNYPISPHAEWLAIAKFSYMLYLYFTLLTGTLLLTCMIQDKIQYHKTISSNPKIFKMQLFTFRTSKCETRQCTKECTLDTMVLE